MCVYVNLIRRSASPLAVSVKQGSDIVLIKSLFTTEHKWWEERGAQPKRSENHDMHNIY